MRKSLRKLQFACCALLLLAMTGCGASTANLGTANSGQPGNITAKLAWGDKTTAKAVAAVPVNVATIQLTVTGSGTGGALPVVQNTISGTSTSGTVNGIYPGKVALAILAKDSTGTTLYEGYALNATIASGATTDVGTVVMSAPVPKAETAACLGCHENTLDETGQSIVAQYKQSGHYTNNALLPVALNKNGSTMAGCAGCHGTSHNDANPDDSGRCGQCHSSVNPNHDASDSTAPYVQNVNGGVRNNCGVCHQPHNPFGQIVGGSCVKCHSVGQNKFSGGTIALVNDNNGVRAITTEFAKWSHHVTGVTLNDAHCAACHLEGTVKNNTIIVDTNKHMVDAKVHLRNVNDDSEFAWDPMAPNHTGMDIYCMACHDANGAASTMSGQIQAYINNNGIAAPGKTASPTNPFGDTISNRYDKMQRPAVVDVNNQFNTTNNSHHAVKGPRYSGRTRAAGARQITSAATFAQNSSALLQGKRSTIYDAGNFNALYSPLGTDGTNATGLGDDSTLHCGDCHTVGQWKVGSSDTANGSPTPAAIGAHGSNNEYLLRNTLGTDQRHTQNAFLQGNITGTVLNPTTGLPIPNGVIVYTNPNGAFLVCYNCHSYTKYGSIYLGTGLNGGTSVSPGQPHAGEYDAQGRCNGIGNTLPFNGYTTGKATDGSQFASRFMGPVTKYSSAAPYVGEQDPDFSNIFGIQCANCHNSGLGNAYGGIHGSAKNTSWNNGTTTIQPDASVTGGAYIDGMGNTNKVERFLPGLGNVMHVPGTLGGFTGGTIAGPVTNSTVTVNGVAGAANVYTYTTGGISKDTNWEQKHWQQQAGTILDPATGIQVGNSAAAGAGCYTLNGSQATGAAIIASDVASGLQGPSVTGAGGATTNATGTWGGCLDHSAGQGKGNHGFVKRIIRPVTY